MEITKVLEKLVEKGFNEERVHSPEDAFMRLINGLEYGDLSNLCSKLQEKIRVEYGDENITIEECYNLTQIFYLDKNLKKIIIEVAYECIDSGRRLGENINSSGFNTSAWISHSLYVARVCSVFANAIGANADIAWTMGIMHDYGRRKYHDFKHVDEGTTALTTLGWYEEASICQIHSYLGADIAYNNEPAPEGYYVDEYGNSKWKSGFENNYLDLFLKQYPYTIYHFLVCLADLMCPDYGVVSAKERLDDIKNRKKFIDVTNRGAFLAGVTNALNYLYFLVHGISWDNFIGIKAAEGVTIDEITKELDKASSLVYGDFVQLTSSGRGSNYCRVKYRPNN